MSPITVVIPSHNRRHVLERTLPTYLALARRHRLVVIDDGSTDGTTPWLRDRGVEVVRIARRSNLGVARNLALEVARTRWVLFGEDDVIMPVDHPQRLLTAAEALPHCAAVCGRLFVGTSWTLPTEQPADGDAPLIDRQLCLLDFAAPLEGSRPLPSLHACALIDRTAAKACGGYDPEYRGSAFREESELYARLWRSGGACWITPSTWAIHVRHRLGGGARGRAGLGAKLRNRISYWRNNAIYIERHHRMWEHLGGCADPGRQKFGWGLRIARETLATAAGRR